MDSIEPFDFSKAQKFDSRFLSGFLAEKYDVDKNEAYDRARLRMANSTNRIVDGSIALSNLKISQNEFFESLGKVDYYLLPVYMLNTDYNGQKYLFAMNGETNKVVGNFPVDKKKVLALFLGLLITSFILGLAAEYVLASSTTMSLGIFAIIVFIYLVFVHISFVSPRTKKKEEKK